jgi:hypothetical protein
MNKLYYENIHPSKKSGCEYNIVVYEFKKYAFLSKTKYNA